MVSQKSSKRIVVDAILRLLCVFISAVYCSHIPLFALTLAQVLIESFEKAVAYPINTYWKSLYHPCGWSLSSHLVENGYNKDGYNKIGKTI